MKKAISILVMGWVLLYCPTLLPAIARGTKIKTSHGLVPVEQLRVGDTVVSQHNGLFFDTPITRISQKSADAFFEIAVNQSVLYATGDQLLFDADIGCWVNAKDLQAHA